MKVVRCELGGRAVHGSLDEARGVVALLDGDPYAGDAAPSGETVGLDEVRLLAPVVPTKILGFGDNYLADGEQRGEFTFPLTFLKPPTAVCGPGDLIVRPDGAGALCFEGELAVVIGRGGRDLAPGDVEKAIAGYTIANDVCARGWQTSDPQWMRGKGSDTFCPLGPWVETDLTLDEASDLALVTSLSGREVQRSRTSRLRRTIRDLVVAVSRSITLSPGDVLLTGTPSGAGEMADGDTVAITIERLGTLANPTGPRP